MHELSVCRALLAQVEQAAATHHADAVHQVTVCLGPLSGVEPELLRAAFAPAARGTLAERAELRIEIVPLRITCARCGMQSEATPNHLVCSTCGSGETRLLSGDELMLVDIRIDSTRRETSADV